MNSLYNEKKVIRPSRFTCCVAIITFVVVCLSAQADGTQIKQNIFAGNSTRAIVSGGNGIYTLFVDDSITGSCGTWTATTAGLHPAGIGLNVLFGTGTPGTSNTTLRSYTSGIDYITGASTICTAICTAAGDPTVTPIVNGATTVGFRLTWTFADGPNSIEFVQEVVVEGPVDGTETVDNTVIRETHFVTNNGPGSFDYGLRKLWDWQIGPDDGPWLGDCNAPTAACDRSMNLTADGSLDGLYPQSYTVNDDPASATCPGGLVPNTPAGCGGVPLYILAGTVQPPAVLMPPPDAPETLQFNDWASLASVCWEPPLLDKALCGAIGAPGDDTAVAYFYGRTVATSETLAMGESKSYTQYVIAAQNSCPTILNPGACCTNAVGFSPCTVTTQNDCEMNLAGTYQGDATDCIMMPCAPPDPPAVLPGEAGFTKDRYISFDPSTNGALPIAFKVTRVGSAMPWYVSCALRNDKGAEGHFSRLIPVPEFCDWTSINQLHVHGCEVVPGNEYVVVATEDNSLFSDSLSIFTTPPQFSAGRQFGDLVGGFVSGMWAAPDGLTTSSEITAVIQKFSLRPEAPLLARMDIDGQDVDEFVSILDVLRSIAGFAAAPFGFGVTDCLTGTCIPDCTLFQATGKCCFLIGEPGAGCVDGVRIDECDAMPAPRNFEDGAFCTGNVLADCPAPISPTIDLFPVSSSGSFAINGNEISLPTGGVTVELELHLSDWGSVGDGLISVLQTKIDSNSYCSGLGVPLNPLGYPGAPVISCPQGNGCPADGSTCNTGAFVVTKRCTIGQVTPPTGSPCDIASCPGGESCEFDPAYLLTPPNPLSDPVPLTGVTFPGLDYLFSGASNVGGIAESGSNGYFGTLLVEVPAGADGTYTIDFINNKVFTFMQDGTATTFPIGTLNPAVISVGGGPTGACCTDAVGFDPCTVTSQDDCEMNLAGTYQGDSTDCGQFPCSCDVDNDGTPDVDQCACAKCELMSPGAVDHVATGGAFKVVFLDGTTQEVLGLVDSNSAFGRSDPFSEGDAEDGNATIVGGGLAPYADTAATTKDPCVFPQNFPENGDCGQEIHVEILSLDLTNGTEAIKAGQAFFDSAPALYQNSIGEAQGECIDLPADIFFDVFFELDLGAPPKLYNKIPVVLRATLQNLPIDLNDPGEDFINDPSFPAVALFDADGIHRAYLVSVSFGDDQVADLPPTSCQSQRGISTTISFDVDSQSNGAVIDAQLNHVSDDAGQQIQQLTVYHSGDQPGEGPDNGNVRYDDLIGQIAGIGGFDSSDVINSISFGQDGTLDPLGANPVLLFSVDRSTIGKPCTDVNMESFNIEVAADVFNAQMNAFGQYVSPSSPVCVGERESCLVLDQTSLGLRPATGGFGHDNMTALEISEYDPMVDFAYLSFTGPTFQNDPTDEAKIWVYAPPPTPLQPGNLNVFASHASMNLQAGDVIDAIAVSDGTPGIDIALDPQMPNGVLDVGLDEVLFSLTSSSPSVTSAGRSGADIFRSSFAGSFSVHITADALGLLETDEVDAIDVSPGFGQNDCNRNGIDDQCDIDVAAANGENIDINSSGIPDDCETRNRYIRFAPDNVGTSIQDVAYRITLLSGPGSTGVLGWIGAPVHIDTPEVHDISFVLPINTPLAQVTRSTWEPVIDVGDCEIMPAAIYGIQATTDGVVFSPMHSVRTILKPVPREWGDAVGSFIGATETWTLPEGIVTASDIVASVKKFQLDPLAPDFTRVDIASQVTNRIITAADILDFVNAFAGLPYPYSYPADCP